MDYKKVIARYREGVCTPEEKAFVDSWYLGEIPDDLAAPDKKEFERMKKEMWKQIHPTSYRRLYSYAAAAVVIIAVGAGIYFSGQVTTPSKIVVLSDVAPGGNRATLTLSNGSKIDLDGTATGKIAQQAGAVISKTNQGQVVYAPSANTSNESSAINTITTPKGGQFVVQLPDGSKVWLNAATSLRFMSDFKGQKNRKVELSGEAYFEVAKRSDQPFIVETGNQTVQVLGTAFNINSYQDEEAVTTTLLKGSIRVFSTKLKHLSEILKPGQRALHQNERIIIQEADENATAWKDGKMKFKDQDLASVMRQVARWYDITVEYEGEIPDRKFTGGILRTTNLSTLLNILELSNIDFTIIDGPRGKTLMVKNK